MNVEDKSELIIELDKVSLPLRNKVLLNNVHLTVKRNQCVVCIGKSGAGKSSLLQLIGGIFPAQYTGYASRFGETLKEGYDPRVGWLPQGLADNLNPHMTIEQHLLEGVILAERSKSKSVNEISTRQSVVESIIQQVSLPLSVLGQFPKYLSGGEIQRVLLALAMISKPELLLLDEPTASLDSQTKALITETLKQLKASTTLFIVTHDLILANALADDILVMASAEIINKQSDIQGEKQNTAVNTSFKEMDRVKKCASKSACMMPVVNINGLSLEYEGRVIFKDFSMTICKNTTNIIYGESGKGKTTLARIIAGWNRQADQYITRIGSSVYLSQHPRSACSPHFTLKKILTEPLYLNNIPIDMEKLYDWLRLVSLPSSEAFLSRKPATLSGGELQRLLIVRAMLAEPDLLIADEPTSALDPDVKAEIVRCFELIQSNTHCAVLIFTHDLEMQTLMGRKGLKLMKNGLSPL